MPKAILRGLCAGSVSALLIFVAATPSGADVPSGAKNARSLIQDLGSQAMDALGRSTPPAQRVQVFRQLLSKDFDLADTARFALGPYARQLTPQQQSEFMALYRDALAGIYAQRLSQYAGEPFDVTGERQSGNETIVSSQVVRPGGQRVRIDWQVTRHDGRLMITDVLVDGVSQKLAQRQEFSGIIQRNGGQPAAVIAALRQQLQTEQPAEPSPVTR
jgi:phospholipid transport system substrate-binding protein